MRSTRVLTILRASANVNDRKKRELTLLLHKMTAFQQQQKKKKNANKVKNISIEMQRNRFETTYNGRLRFKPNYRLCVVKGSIVV